MAAFEKLKFSKMFHTDFHHVLMFKVRTSKKNISELIEFLLNSVTYTKIMKEKYSQLTKEDCQIITCCY